MLNTNNLLKRLLHNRFHWYTKEKTLVVNGTITITETGIRTRTTTPVQLEFGITLWTGQHIPQPFHETRPLFIIHFYMHTSFLHGSSACLFLPISSCTYKRGINRVSPGRASVSRCMQHGGVQPGLKLTVSFPRRIQLSISPHPSELRINLRT